MIWLARLLGVGRWLRDTALRYPWQALCVALVVALAWTWAGWGKAERQRDEARASLAEQVEQYRAAHSRAVAAHNAARMAEEARTAAIKDKADAVATLRRESALRASERYSAANRVQQCSQADPGVASGADLPGPATSPGSAETGREAATMVAVTPEAVTNCTLNTADLQTAVDWARDLWGGSDGR